MLLAQHFHLISNT